jgi:hypothetical protein
MGEIPYLTRSASTGRWPGGNSVIAPSTANRVATTAGAPDRRNQDQYQERGKRLNWRFPVDFGQVRQHQTPYDYERGRGGRQSNRAASDSPSISPVNVSLKRSSINLGLRVLASRGERFLQACVIAAFGL